MKAIVQDTYGPTAVLELRDIDRPRPAAGEVLVEVRAAGVDRGVWHLMTGLPYPVRFAGYGVRAPKNGILGMDVAGVVAEVGSGVTGFERGDEVFGIAKGSFAEYARVPADKLARKPRRLTFEQAAGLAISGLAALQAVRDRGRVVPGQRVLVVGASGGVGTYAVQIAKAFGAEVTGVASTAKVELVRSLGADHVIDYRHADFADGRRQYDVILDIGGNTSLSRLRRALTPTGTLVIVGGEGGGRWLGGTDRQVRAMLLSPFVRQRLGTFISSENAADLHVLHGLVEAGQVTPVVDRTFALPAAGEAIEYVEGGHARGKVVLTV
ncbi:MAG: NAD(P)-dependent alcohol dehydrogenase [Nocardioidaceae bacterium]